MCLPNFLRFSVYYPGMLLAKSYFLKSSTILSKYALSCSLYLQKYIYNIRFIQGKELILLLANGFIINQKRLYGNVAQQKAESHVELLCLKIDILLPN